MNKKIRINLVALIVGIIIVCIIIGLLISRKKRDNDVEIQYTNQLNYVTYTDENGNYVIQYDNGDKTIETRQPNK